MKAEKKQGKKAQIKDYIFYIVIGLLVLALAFAAVKIFVLKDLSAIDYLKNLIRFGK